MREKVVLISLLSDANEIVGFRCFSYKSLKVFNISVFDIKKFNILGLDNSEFEKLINAKGKLKGYRCLPIINLRMNEILNREYLGLGIWLTLIGKLKEFKSQDSLNMKYLVSLPFGQLMIVDREYILKNVLEGNWCFTNLIQSSVNIKLLQGIIPIIPDLDGLFKKKLEIEYYKPKNKNILTQIKLNNLKEKYKNGFNLDTISLMKLKEYRDRLLYTDFMKRNDFLFHEISETFTKEEKENMASVFYGITHFNKDMGSVILSSVSLEIQERLKKKKTMSQVSNFVNRDLLKYTLERRNSFKCLLPKCDDFFKTLDSHLNLERVKRVRDFLQKYILCQDCDIYKFIWSSVYLYSKKSVIGVHSILRSDSVCIDAERLKNIHGLKTLCHEYFHYISSDENNSGIINYDKYNKIQKVMNEGITEILSCSLLYLLVKKLERNHKNIYNKGIKINVNDICNLYFLVDLKNINSEICLDNLLDIVSYKNNVKLMLKIMQLVGVDCIKEAYFLNDFVKLKMEVIKQIGEDKYNYIEFVILQDNNIRNSVSLSNTAYSKILKELGGI